MVLAITVFIWQTFRAGSRTLHSRNSRREHRVQRIGRRGRQADRQLAAALCHLKRLAVGEQVRFGYLRQNVSVHAIQRELLPRPGEEMDVQLAGLGGAAPFLFFGVARTAVLVGLAGNGLANLLAERRAARAVNGFAVDLQPGAHLCAACPDWAAE